MAEFKTALITKCHIEHPQRPVNWRWERARFLKENRLSKLLRKDEDIYVYRALKFRHSLEKCRDEVDQYRLMDVDRNLYYAYEMWDQEEGEEQYGSNSNPLRYEVEARLLTNETPEQIAKKTGCSKEAVEWYERLFFNVKDRRHLDSYVLHQAIGPALHRGAISERHYDLLWKLFAYEYGPIALECLMSQTTNPIQVTSRSQMESVFIDDTKSTIRRRSALAARTLRSDSLSQISLLDIHHKFQMLEKDMLAGQQEATILENIRAMMGQLPWAVGRQPSDKMDQNIINYYDKANAAEPRANELVLSGVGKAPDSLKQLGDMKFPPPPTGSNT